MPKYLEIGTTHHGDSRQLIDSIKANSIALSVWSPPYFVGKSYEKDLTYQTWQAMLCTVIEKHYRILRPGAFLAINIADILCYPDPQIPKIQAENLRGNRLPVSRQDVMDVLKNHPNFNRYQVAEALGVSEQTVDRRMNNNNIRGGKHATQTRVALVGCMLENAAYGAGLYLYDRRVWVKDPCWENSRWHTNSYRAVDEFEYVYIFWKPGITTVDRNKLSRQEWVEWGSRAVWYFPSVRANNDHEAKFPAELPRRLIRLLTVPKDTVLDCFMGSGTTGIAATQEGRQFIGIEKEAKYVRLAQKACNAIHPKYRATPPENPSSRHELASAAPANGTSSSNGESSTLF